MMNIKGLICILLISLLTDVVWLRADNAWLSTSTHWHERHAGVEHTVNANTIYYRVSVHNVPRSSLQNVSETFTPIEVAAVSAPSYSPVSVMSYSSLSSYSSVKRSARRASSAMRRVSRRMNAGDDDDIPDPGSWADPFGGDDEEDDDIPDPGSWIDPFSGGSDIEDIPDPGSWVDPYAGELETPVGDCSFALLMLMVFAYIICYKYYRNGYDA